ncbi:hypothetical protein DVH24_025581 [Malus domestica]|uniref:Uncharacterized protein n=1 Tax=Malus domestica TaxID=3750 RepID=A0A498HMX5_MALDO|nr:hypothetical protein DVH24_025581 [Malus domestica]
MVAELLDNGFVVLNDDFILLNEKWFVALFILVKIRWFVVICCFVYSCQEMVTVIWLFAYIYPELFSIELHHSGEISYNLYVGGNVTYI